MVHYCRKFLHAAFVGSNICIRPLAVYPILVVWTGFLDIAVQKPGRLESCTKDFAKFFNADDCLQMTFRKPSDVLQPLLDVHCRSERQEEQLSSRNSLLSSGPELCL